MNSAVNEPLITKFRIVFLEVLRKCFHRHIHQGRLPRGSQAALVLLNSIDIGLQTVHTDGLQDWDAVQQSINSIDRTSELLARAVCWLQKWGCGEGTFLCTVLLENQSILDSNKIYILTSFIYAHTYAQQHIPYYLGEEEGISTPEEALIVRYHHHCSQPALSHTPPHTLSHPPCRTASTHTLSPSPHSF